MVKIYSNLFTVCIALLLAFIIPNSVYSAENSGKEETSNSGPVERLFCISDRHVHLSVGKDPASSMIISFSSLPCDLPQRSKWHRDHSKADFEFMKTNTGVIRFGTDPQHLNFIVEEEKDGAQRYNSTVKFTHRQFVYYSDWYHHITLTNLQPDTVYYYQCGTWWDDHHGDGRSLRKRNLNSPQVFSFRTGPAKRREVSMVVIGDVGVRSHSMELFRQLAIPEKKKDLVLLVGDITYSDHDHRTWDKWMDVMVDEMEWLRYTPLQVAAGNHDVEVDEERGEIFQSYKTRFQMPQVRPTVVRKPTYQFDNNLGMNLPYEFGNSFYSFSYGSLVRVFVLNSYAEFLPNSTQYDWFIQELQAVNRTETPWIMVAIHCPPYTTFKFHRRDPQLSLAKEFLEPVFIQYGVNLVVSGHVHAYMRTFPIKDFQLSPDGPMYFIIGNGGRNVNTPFINSTAPEPWVANRDHLTYGYANFTFINETTLFYQWTQTGMNHLGEGDEGFDFQPPCPNYTLYDSHYFHNPHHAP